MISKVRVPTVDTNIEEVTLTAWLKREGETVRKGEPLAELTTAKACVEFESPCAGILRRRLAAEKSNLPPGYIIALVGAAADPLPDVSARNAALLAKHRAAAAKAAPRPAPRRAGPAPRGAGPVGGRLRATPAARRLARERGIDLARVKAAGEVITERDVAACQ